MTYEEAVDLVGDCMNELGKRFIMTQHKFVVQKVDKVFWIFFERIILISYIGWN